MGLDLRISAASVDSEQYRELAEAFPSNEDRELILRAMSEPLPPPVVYVFAAAKRKVSAMFSSQRKSTING